MKSRCTVTGRWDFSKEARNNNETDRNRLVLLLKTEASSSNDPQVWWLTKTEGWKFKIAQPSKIRERITVGTNQIAWESHLSGCSHIPESFALPTLWKNITSLSALKRNKSIWGGGDSCSGWMWQDGWWEIICRVKKGPVVVMVSGARGQLFISGDALPTLRGETNGKIHRLEEKVMAAGKNGQFEIFKKKRTRDKNPTFEHTSQLQTVHLLFRPPRRITNGVMRASERAEWNIDGAHDFMNHVVATVRCWQVDFVLCASSPETVMFSRCLVIFQYVSFLACGQHQHNFEAWKREENRKGKKKLSFEECVVCGRRARFVFTHTRTRQRDKRSSPASEPWQPIVDRCRCPKPLGTSQV